MTPPQLELLEELDAAPYIEGYSVAARQLEAMGFVVVLHPGIYRSRLAWRAKRPSRPARISITAAGRIALERHRELERELGSWADPTLTG